MFETNTLKQILVFPLASKFKLQRMAREKFPLRWFPSLYSAEIPILSLIWYVGCNAKLLSSYLFTRIPICDLDARTFLLVIIIELFYNDS